MGRAERGDLLRRDARGALPQAGVDIRVMLAVERLAPDPRREQHIRLEVRVEREVADLVVELAVDAVRHELAERDERLIELAVDAGDAEHRRVRVDVDVEAAAADEEPQRVGAVVAVRTQPVRREQRDAALGGWLRRGAGGNHEPGVERAHARARDQHDAETARKLERLHRGHARVGAWCGRLRRGRIGGDGARHLVDRRRER